MLADVMRRLRPWGTYAAVILAVLLALRCAVEVAPDRVIEMPQSRWDLDFPKYSDVAGFGDSRFISPPDWAARPVGFEIWFVYRGIADAIVGVVIPAAIPHWYRKLVVYSGWFFAWLMLIAWASGHYVRRAYGAVAEESPFANRLLVVAVLVYAYCVHATQPMYVPYDLVAAACEFVLFALIWAFWDEPTLSHAAALALACVLGIFVKESLLMGVVALLLAHLLDRSRPHWAATALFLVVSLLIAWKAQDLYIRHVLGTPQLWERSFTYFKGVIFSNVLFLLGRTTSPGGFKTAVMFILPLLIVLTPIYRSGLEPGKARILRLTMLIFLATLMIVGNPRESRIIVEFAVLAYVFRPLERLGFSSLGSAGLRRL